MTHALPLFLFVTVMTRGRPLILFVNERLLTICDYENSWLTHDSVGECEDSWLTVDFVCECDDSCVTHDSVCECDGSWLTFDSICDCDDS